MENKEGLVIIIKPIIISITGIVPKLTNNQLEALETGIKIVTMQKAVVLDICHLVRKFLGKEFDLAFFILLVMDVCGLWSP